MTTEIIDNVVVRVLIGTSATHCSASYGGQWKDIDTEPNISVGWTWDGEKFNPPAPEGT